MDAASRTSRKISASWRWAIVGSTITHLLVGAVSVCFAAWYIESILFSGWVVSGTGLLLSIIAILTRQWRLVIAGGSTIFLCIGLFTFEQIVCLGPAGATLPFCIVFFMYQAWLVPWSLWSVMGVARTNRDANKTQFSLQFLIALTVACSVALGLTRLLPQQRAAWLSAVASTEFAVTMVGITMTVFYGFFARGAGPSGAQQETR